MFVFVKGGTGTYISILHARDLQLLGTKFQYIPNQYADLNAILYCMHVLYNKGQVYTIIGCQR